MIQQLSSLEPYLPFVADVNGDPCFSDPMLTNEEQIRRNLLNAVQKPNDHVLGVFCDGKMTGLFVFLIIEQERYIEMIVGLSRSEKAYEEILAYLQSSYAGFWADFVFNPKNGSLRTLLTQKGAVFCEEQQKMILTGDVPAVETDGVERLSDRYMDQYLAMHGTDCYWTGEKVAATPERFNAFVAVDHGTVVGYLDVTNCFDENEPFDLLVLESHRRKGWGRKLIAKAIEENRPKAMMLLTEVSNSPAIALYESVGFVKVQGQNNLTATWNIP